MTEKYDREFVFELECQLSAVIYLFQKLFSSEEFCYTDIKDEQRINNLHTSIDMAFKKLCKIDSKLQKYAESLYE